jgi:scyllo-inositol 2-dehydrogenase (NADP+)
VIPDLGSHMLDIALFVLGEAPAPTTFELLDVRRFENRSPDYALFGTRASPQLLCEASLLSWRNTFRADLVAERGSAHIDCLCKWGPSVLSLRRRVLPSGRPSEEVQTIESKDPTWRAEHEHFRALCATPSRNIDNDLWINRVIRNLWVEGSAATDPGTVTA